MASNTSRAERKAAKEQQREARHAEWLAKQEQKAAEKERQAAQAEQRAFLESLQGQARTAYERGDQILQLACPLESQKAIIAPMMGGTTTNRSHDHASDLNRVVGEGWELVTASMVFQQTGEESRDKFMSSGQNVAISGQLVGFYLFRRAPKNKTEAPA